MADSDEDDDLSEEDMADAWGAALAEQGAGGDDDDDLAAAWGAALEEQGAGSSDDMAAQWAAMIDDSEPDLEKRDPWCGPCSQSGGNRQSPGLQYRGYDCRRPERYPGTYQFGDGLLRAIADARDCL